MSALSERSSLSFSGQAWVPATIREVIQRIEAEYREMPGLMLTARRAQRLWGLDSPTCATAPITLLQRGFLKQTADGAYVLLEESCEYLQRPLQAETSDGRR